MFNIVRLFAEMVRALDLSYNIHIWVFVTFCFCVCFFLADFVCSSHLLKSLSHRLHVFFSMSTSRWRYESCCCSTCSCVVLIVCHFCDTNWWKQTALLTHTAYTKREQSIVRIWSSNILENIFDPKISIDFFIPDWWYGNINISLFIGNKRDHLWSSFWEHYSSARHYSSWIHIICDVYCTVSGEI